MTLPASPSASNYDAAGDDPAQARAQLKTLRDAVDTLITHLAASTLTNTAGPAAPGGGLEVVSAVLQAKASFRAVTSADTIVASDRGKVLDCTASGFSVAVTAAGTLGDGFFCWVRNSAASGNITIDPNASEEIDGVLTISLGPGEACFIGCNGSLLRTVGRRMWRPGTQLSKNPYATASSTTQAHGLPSVPQLLDARLICLTGEGGYSVGDVIDLGAAGLMERGSTLGTGIQMIKDATNVVLIIGDTAPAIINKATGAQFVITPSSWRIAIDPYYLG